MARGVDIRCFLVTILSTRSVLWLLAHFHSTIVLVMGVVENVRTSF